jgi:hypothetical protein
MTSDSDIALTTASGALDSRRLQLPPRALALLYLAAAEAFVPSYGLWVRRTGRNQSVQLETLLRQVRTFVETGEPVVDVRSQIEVIVEMIPHGDDLRVPSEFAAQNCWICVSCAMSIGEGDRTQDSLWYVLEPSFAVGDNLDSANARDDRGQTTSGFGAAVGFCEWAIGYLATRPQPTSSDIERVVSAAIASLSLRLGTGDN